MQYGHGEMKWINSYWKLRRKTLHSAWSSIVTDVASKRKEKETKKEKKKSLQQRYLCRKTIDIQGK